MHATNDEWGQRAVVAGYGGPYSRIFSGRPGDAIDVKKASHYLIVEKAKPTLPDMFWSAGSLLVVSERYHDIIESLDPGVHQMWQIEMRRKRKGPYPGRWFAVNVRPRASAIQEEGSDIRVQPLDDQLQLPRRVWIRDSFKTSVISSGLPYVNLWWDDGIDDSIMICSDRFRDVVIAAGLKSIPFVKAKEID